jgi:NADPH-dependent curcumin reductase CurA
VIGIAGSDEKCQVAVNEFGFDHCINHRTFETAKALRIELTQHAPDGIDIYFENVAGPILEAVLPMMKVDGRIPVCGMISWYNAGSLGGDALIETLSAPKIWRSILVNRLSVNGFIISDHWDHFSTFLTEVAPMVNDGQIKFIEDTITGLENAPKTFIGMLDGKNHGKTVIKLR